MTIYTSAALTEPLNVCDQGKERTRAALARLGLEWHSRVTIDLILDTMGLSDAVFSCGAVEPRSRAEADDVLVAYAATLPAMCDSLWRPAMLPRPAAVEEARHLFGKRLMGKPREAQARALLPALLEASKESPNPVERMAMEFWVAMINPDKPMYLVATHGGMWLIDMAVAEGGVAVGQRMVQTLTETFRQILNEAGA